jgi:hypothetical protein
MDGTEASSANKSASTLPASVLAAGVFPEVMSHRSELMSFASLALVFDAATVGGELTEFVLVVL